MLLASGCFATMSAFIKAIGLSLPLPELVFLRCLLSLPFLFFFVRMRQRPLIVKARKLILLRTLFGMTAMCGFFFALTHLPFAECIFLGRTQPLFIALLAPFILEERVPAVSWFAIATGLCGVVLIPAAQRCLVNRSLCCHRGRLFVSSGAHAGPTPQCHGISSCHSI